MSCPYATRATPDSAWLPTAHQLPAHATSARAEHIKEDMRWDRRG